MSKGLILLCDSSRGDYIPQVAVEKLEAANWNLDCSNGDLNAVKAGPEHDWYWDGWTNIESSATLKDEDGNVWCLHLDGDLWAVCHNLMTEQEKKDFFGND